MLFEKELEKNLLNNIQNQKKEDNQIELIKTSTKNLILSKPLEQFYFESKLEIKNVSSNYIAFYITKDKKMSSTTFLPSIYFLIPDETISVNIKRMENVSFLEI